MSDISNEKLAQNEKLFRHANEKVERTLQQVIASHDKIHFVCECSDMNCEERIELTSVAFNDLHASPRLFIIKPRHETVEIEKVVKKTKTFWIVEKFVAPA